MAAVFSCEENIRADRLLTTGLFQNLIAIDSCPYPFPALTNKHKKWSDYAILVMGRVFTITITMCKILHGYLGITQKNYRIAGKFGGKKVCGEFGESSAICQTKTIQTFPF